MLSILEENGIGYRYNKAENVLQILETKSRMLFRSLDEYERLRGTNLAWFGIDELTYTSEEAWMRLEGRLRDPKATRLGGFGVWTPNGFDWVYRRFIQDPVEGYQAVLARPYENRFVLDRVPDYYERLKKSYDARFFAQEAMGEYVNIGAGRVYESFDRARNVKKLEMESGLPLLWTLDFNVDPMCSVVAQKSAGGELRVLDEIVLRRASTVDACEEFRSRYPAHASAIVIYGDATGARLQTSGTTDYRMVREFMARAGYRKVEFRVPTSNPSVRQRVLLVNGMLRSAADETELYMDPKCKELIQDMEQVSYKPDSLVIDKEKDLKRTHLSDALGYLVWQECRPQPRYGERGERLL
jgi:hypothetical protein